MNTKLENQAKKLLRRDWDELGKDERTVLESIENRSSVARNINCMVEDERTFGERVADGVAAFGGSWAFMGLFAAILIFWVIINSFVLARRNDAFDPYPYILLNLFLSMLAAIQAPVIMMSQNRHASRDRIDAAHDYEVNLKSELEIRSLHEKLDGLSEEKWAELVEIQRQQLRMLEKVLHEQIKPQIDRIY